MQKESNDCVWRFQSQVLQLLIFLYVESSGIIFQIICSGVLQECSITNAGEHFLLSGMDV